MYKRHLHNLSLIMVLVAILATGGCADSPRNQEEIGPDPQYHSLDYSIQANWAYFESDGSQKADCLLINPCSECFDKSIDNIDLNNPKHRADFVATLNRERHIYDGCANMYAPFYRSTTLSAFYRSPGLDSTAFKTAYADVASAIDYYLSHSQNDRPLILASFSQGSLHMLHYLKEKGNSPALQNRLVAVYALGWRFTPEDVDPCPWIRMAQTEDDLGTVITFDCEEPGTTSTLFVPQGEFTYSINPLSWTTTGDLADKSLNKGACFYNGKGELTKEIPELTGCYIDHQRGTLICPDVSTDEFPGVIVPDGSYHIYDYWFFFRNLQENVAIRLKAFLQRTHTENFR